MDQPPENKVPPPQKPALRQGPSPFFILVLILGLLLLYLITSSQDGPRSKITYGFFRQQLAADNIAEVTVEGVELRGKFKVAPIDPAALAEAAEAEKKEAEKTESEKAEKPATAEKDQQDADDKKDAKPAAEDKDDAKADKDTSKAEGKEKSKEKKELRRLHEQFVTTLPEFALPDRALDDLLIEKLGDNYKANPRKDSTGLVLTVYLLVTIALFVGVWFMFRRARDSFGGGLMSGFSKSPARRYDSTNRKVTFDDVAGLEGVKNDLQEVVEYLKNPAKFQRLGGRVPKGLLLMGPPGTGKTLLGRAIAGEAGVPFFSINGSEFIQMFVGVGASRVRDLFKTAKESAPAILFIDEIDAVGRHRGAGLGGGHDEREQTLNQILSEMDGFLQTETVIVVAATNRPDVLDPALLRPGRFDRHIVVDRPTVKGRLAIFDVHTRDVPLDADVDLDRLAAGTVGMTGADIRNLVNEAALWASRHDKNSVQMTDFEYARDKVLMGSKREEVLTGKEKRMTAYHEAGHTLVAWLEPKADRLHKVSIIPRGRALGVTQLLPEEDRLSIGEGELQSQLLVLLGGRTAEKLVFDEYAVGAASDLDRATEIARRMVTHWGMSERLGPAAFHDGEDHPFLGKEMTEPRRFSEHTAEVVDEEIMRILREASDKATRVLTENRDKLDRLAETLEERETLDDKEIEELIGPPVPNPDTVAKKDAEAESDGKSNGESGE